MRNLVLLGFHVGDRYFEHYSKGDAFPQVAAYKLESRLLAALRSAGVQVRTVASIAVSTFPRINRVWFPAARIHDGEEQVGQVLPLINLPLVKMVWRFLGAIFYLLKTSRGTDGICVYAAHSPNLLAAYLCSRIYRIPYYIYIPDLPGFMDVALKRSWLRTVLKKIDASLLNWLVGGAAGLMVISRPMVEDIPAWKSRPCLVLEGIADASPAMRIDSEGPRKTIFYAGGVNRAYGIEELVEGFLTAEIDYDLVICGRGDLEGYLVKTAARHSSVRYLGFLPPNEVAELQAQAAVLVLSRNPAEAFTRYSFPSKLIEYMSAGIPVLTTRLEGIPADYFEYLNVIEGFSAEAVAQALVKFSVGDQARLSAKAELGKMWVLETKTSIAVGKRVIEFMENSK